MKRKEKIYQDSDLASRQRVYLIRKCGFPESRVTQRTNEIFIQIGPKGNEREYTSEFFSKNGNQYFAIHIENPKENTFR